MKKIFTLFLSVLMVFTMAGCSSNDIPTTGGKGTTTIPKFPSDMNQSAITDPTTQTPDDDTSAPNVSNTPQTVMDLFKGERKLWYVLLDYDKPRHDSEILSVIVTEDSKTIGYYYRLHEYDNTILLSDLEGMTDVAILELVQEKYYDASKAVDVNYHLYDDGTVFGPIAFPQQITYWGALDDSGNQLVDETVVFFDSQAAKNFFFIHNEMRAGKIVMPSIVKDTEYIGIRGATHSAVTRNTYSDFQYPKFDSPDGATETY